jgi:[acyl-carrier-protein] S-malonyltransferase
MSMTAFAFVFPGQGSQAVGMLDGWGDHPEVTRTLREASDALNEDVGRLIKEGSKEALALTTNTQPVMLVAGVAAWRVWLAEGGKLPAVVAGHSLGEYSPLVRFRAAAMQDAVPVGTGAMAAILGMPAEQVIAGCAEVQAMFAADSGEVVEAANFNDVAQTVIAGSKAAVEMACEVLKSQGAKRALPLSVSAPFHSSLMKPAAEKLREKLSTTSLATPQIPVLNNIDVSVESEADRIRDALFRQAFGPVRWVECVKAIQTRGVNTVVECGPGKVLAGMCKRIDAGLTGVALYDPASLVEVKALLA